MNRIYQGRVTNVEILNPASNSLTAPMPLAQPPPSPHPMGRGAGGEVSDESKPATTRKAKVPDDWQPFDSDPVKARMKWEDKLWQHHELFQDAVN
jgi:hypothetical protein